MTIADRQHATTLRRLAAPPAAHAPAAERFLVVAWDVSDGAVGGVLEWRIREGAGDAVAVWRPASGDAVTMATAAGVVRVVDERGMEHVDVPGGMLALTLRWTADGPRVVYARSALLRVLGVRGGSVDHPVGRVEERQTEPARR
jgi:hypothetical protein